MEIFIENECKLLGFFKVAIRARMNGRFTILRITIYNAPLFGEQELYC